MSETESKQKILWREQIICISVNHASLNHMTKIYILSLPSKMHECVRARERICSQHIIKLSKCECARSNSSSFEPLLSVRKEENSINLIINARLFYFPLKKVRKFFCESVCRSHEILLKKITKNFSEKFDNKERVECIHNNRALNTFSSSTEKTLRRVCE